MQDSSVNVNEQVLIRLVLNGDWDILVIVLGNSEDGIYSGVGEHLDNVSSEAGEVTVLELERAALVRSGKFAVAEADLVKFRHLNQPVGDGQGQVEYNSNSRTVETV